MNFILERSICLKPLKDPFSKASSLKKEKPETLTTEPWETAELTQRILCICQAILKIFFGL